LIYPAIQKAIPELMKKSRIFERNALKIKFHQQDQSLKTLSNIQRFYRTRIENKRPFVDSHIS